MSKSGSDVFAGDPASVAELFPTGRAVLALLAAPPQRLHTDPVAHGEPVGAVAVDGDRARHLMARDDRADRGHTTLDPVAFDHVQVRAAYPAPSDTDQQLPRPGRRS
jgi:hypothetical protein